MDDAVLRSMAKWPNVPAVYGWLRLDRRGNWLLKGERINNPAIVECIGRNYEPDAQGRWTIHAAVDTPATRAMTPKIQIAAVRLATCASVS